MSAPAGQMRLLVGAGWRSLLRSGRRRPGTALAAGVGAFAFVLGVTVTAAAAGAWVDGLVGSGRVAPAAAAVHLAYLGAFVTLASAPLLGARARGFLDPTRLAALPVTPRTVRNAAVVAACLTPAAIVSAAAILAVSLGFAASPQSVVPGLAAGALVFAAGLLCGQVAHAQFRRALRGRPWSDAAALATALGGTAVFALVMAWASGVADGDAEAALAAFGEHRHLLLWLPSWWGAEAVTGETVARIAPATLLAVLVYVLWRLAERQAADALTGAGPRSASSRPRAPLRPFLRRLLGDRLAVLVGKDLALLRRDPVVRLVLVQHAAAAVAAVVLIAWRATPDALGLAAYPLALAELGIFLNLLGLEGGGALHALRTPVGRFRYLFAKQLACLLVFGALNALVTGLLFVAVTAGREAHAGTLTMTLAEVVVVTAVALGAGAVGSVLAPFRVASAGHGPFDGAPARGPGLLGAARAWLGVALVGLALMPFAVWLHQPALARAAGSADTSLSGAATGSAALGLAALVMTGGAWLAARVLLRREGRVAQGLMP